MKWCIALCLAVVLCAAGCGKDSSQSQSQSESKSGKSGGSAQKGGTSRASSAGDDSSESTSPPRGLFGSFNSARQIASMNQLRNISLALKAYTANYSGIYPPRLDASTMGRFGVTAEMLTNPRAPDRKPGYVYLGAGLREGWVRPDTLILYESFGTWPEGGVAAAFGDCSVRTIDDPDKLQALVKATEALKAGKASE